MSYAIGVPEPLSIFIDTYGTGKISDAEILEKIKAKFDFRAGAAPAPFCRFLGLLPFMRMVLACWLVGTRRPPQAAALLPAARRPVRLAGLLGRAHCLEGGCGVPRS